MYTYIPVFWVFWGKIFKIKVSSLINRSINMIKKLQSMKVLIIQF